MSYDRYKRPNGVQSLRRRLAMRDGALEVIAVPNGQITMTRCQSCGCRLPIVEATIGHVKAIRLGGTNEESNLRLECEPCNAADARRMDLERAPVTPAPEMIKNGVHRKNKRRTPLPPPTQLYDSVRVLDCEGNPIALTSCRRAHHLSGRGVVRVLREDGEGRPAEIQLVQPKEIKDPFIEPIKNECVVCGCTRELLRFRIWPNWHPKSRDMRKTRRTAVVCRRCQGPLDRRIQFAMVEAVGPVQPEDATDLRKRVGIVLQYYRCLKRSQEIPPELGAAVTRELGCNPQTFMADDGLTKLSAQIKSLKSEERARLEAPGEELRRRVISSGIDLAALFWAAVRG